MQLQTESHYSDQTLVALMTHPGWTAGPEIGGGLLLSVERTFAGKIFSAGYGDDPTRRRYIALKLGETFVVDVDGRGLDPAEVARTIDAAASQVMGGLTLCA